ncbi:MAG: hypothetical protein ACRDPI_01935 [Nocardioidaceae bacterium]
MRTNSLNAGYLVVGVAFLGIAATWALVVSDALPGSSLRFALPLVLVVAGVIGLVAMVIPGSRRGHQDAVPPLDDTDPMGE